MPKVRSMSIYGRLFMKPSHEVENSFESRSDPNVELADSKVSLR